LIKVGDIGFFEFYDPANRKSPGSWGTAVCWPPEQTWGKREATPEGDIWVVGCDIHELAHGFPPVVDPDFAESLAQKDPKVPKPPSDLNAVTK